MKIVEEKRGEWGRKDGGGGEFGAFPAKGGGVSVHCGGLVAPVDGGGGWTWANRFLDESGARC